MYIFERTPGGIALEAGGLQIAPLYRTADIEDSDELVIEVKAREPAENAAITDAIRIGKKQPA